MTYLVYILQSERDGKRYTGITNDIARRLKQHNKGHSGTPSTKNRGPFALKYQEEVEDLRTARKREKYLKSGAGRSFIKKKEMCTTPL